MLRLTANELTTFLLIELILATAGALIDLTRLDNRLPYAYCSSFVLSAGLLFSYQFFK